MRHWECIGLLGDRVFAGNALGDSVTLFGGAVQLTNRPDDGSATQVTFSGSLAGQWHDLKQRHGASGSFPITTLTAAASRSAIWLLNVSGSGNFAIPSGFDELTTTGDLGFIPTQDVNFSLNGSLTYSGINGYRANNVSLAGLIFDSSFNLVGGQSKSQTGTLGTSLSITGTGLLLGGQEYFYLPDIGLDGTASAGSGTATGRPLPDLHARGADHAATTVGSGRRRVAGRVGWVECASAENRLPVAGELPSLIEGWRNSEDEKRDWRAVLSRFTSSSFRHCSNLSSNRKRLTSPPSPSSLPCAPAVSVRRVCWLGHQSWRRF